MTPNPTKERQKVEQTTARERALVEAAREAKCKHEPITKGDWCFRGLCRHCGQETAQYEEPKA